MIKTTSLLCTLLLLISITLVQSHRGSRTTLVTSAPKIKIEWKDHITPFLTFKASAKCHRGKFEVMTFFFYTNEDKTIRVTALNGVTNKAIFENVKMTAITETKEKHVMLVFPSGRVDNRIIKAHSGKDSYTPKQFSKISALLGIKNHADLKEKTNVKIESWFVARYTNFNPLSKFNGQDSCENYTNKTRSQDFPKKSTRTFYLTKTDGNGRWVKVETTGKDYQVYATIGINEDLTHPQETNLKIKTLRPNRKLFFGRGTPILKFTNGNKMWLKETTQFRTFLHHLKKLRRNIDGRGTLKIGTKWLDLKQGGQDRLSA